jgi:hypothetical protein
MREITYFIIIIHYYRVQSLKLFGKLINCYIFQTKVQQVNFNKSKY